VDPDGVVAYVSKPELLPSVRARPGKPGDLISIYGTGFGPSNPQRPSGFVIEPAVLARVATVRIGNRDATVAYAGLAGAGLNQLNIVIPDLPAGDHLIASTVEGTTTQGETYITIER
jgi:uncharacterized protein (TIGR03437 family)